MQRRINFAPFVLGALGFFALCWVGCWAACTVWRDVPYAVEFGDLKSWRTLEVYNPLPYAIEAKVVCPYAPYNLDGNEFRRVHIAGHGVIRSIVPATYNQGLCYVADYQKDE